MIKNAICTAVIFVVLVFTLNFVNILEAINEPEEIPQAERTISLITPKAFYCMEASISNDGKMVVAWCWPPRENPKNTGRLMAINLDESGNPISQKELFRANTMNGPKVGKDFENGEAWRFDYSGRNLLKDGHQPKVNGNGRVAVWEVSWGILMVANTDGSNLHLIVPQATIPGRPKPTYFTLGGVFAMSDDGKRIVSQATRWVNPDAGPHVVPLIAFSSDGDGSDGRLLLGPRWSREKGFYYDPPYPSFPRLVGITGNGEKIVFLAKSSEKTYAIYVLNWDGSGLKRISPNFRDWSGVTLPHNVDIDDVGMRVIFYHSDDKKIYKVNIDGSGLTPILRADGSSPVGFGWSASLFNAVYLSGDGTKILSRRDVIVNNKKVKAVTLHDINTGIERVIMDWMEPNLPEYSWIAGCQNGCPPCITSYINERGDKVLFRGEHPDAQKLGGSNRFACYLLNIKGIARPRDFDISFISPSKTIRQGEKASFDVRLGSLEGFSSPVSLSLSGLPSGATWAFTPASVIPTGNSNLIITTTAAVSIGTFDLTLKGVSGSLIHTYPLKLTIEPRLIHREMTLIAESRKVAPGATVQVPIRLEKAEATGSLGFNLSYDSSVIQVSKVLKGTLMAPATFSYNAKTPGVIRFGFATTKGISGDGSAAVVEFKAVGGEGSKSPLTLSKGEATDTSGVPLSFRLVNGELAIIEERIIGDCNGDKKITAVDALCALQMYVKLRDFDSIMDMNEDGQVTPEDARQILKMAKR